MATVPSAPARPCMLQVVGDAARAVAALLDLAAVGIEDPVMSGRARHAWWLEHQRLVETDAGVPVGQLAPLRRHWAAAPSAGASITRKSLPRPCIFVKAMRIDKS